MALKKFYSMVIGLIIGLVLTGCASQQPILIGFAGELTGPRGELGVAARDGALLAVEMVNDNGGVLGRPLKLLVKDDQGNPDTARRVDTELVDEGVVAIIGHITSEQTAAAFDQMNQARVVLFSPASASTLFSQQEDYFFRNISDTNRTGTALATYIYQRNVHALAVIYDTDNRTFTETFWQAVQTKFEALGGHTDKVFTFSHTQTNLSALISQVKASQPEEVILFVASAVDTALMAQYIRQQHLTTPLFSTSWAQTNELLTKGGRAIEGLEILTNYDPHNSYPRFQPFIDHFQARYGHQPDFLSAYAYEAVLLLAYGLQQTSGQVAGLPQALTTVHNFAGVQGPISIDKYGDVQRDVYIAQVKNGQFVIIKTIPAAD